MSIRRYLSTLRRTIAGLDNPDAGTRQTLYQWCANQAGHAALALVTALAASEFGAGPFRAAVIGVLAWCLKEYLLDLGKRRTALTIADSATDGVFYALGAFIAYGHLHPAMSLFWGLSGLAIALTVLGYFRIGKRT